MATYQLLKLDSFVDRDMYMRYRGGGVGHVVPVDVPDPLPTPDDLLHIPQDCEDEQEMGGYLDEDEDIEEPEGDDEDDDVEDPKGEDEVEDDDEDEEDTEGHGGQEETEREIGELMNDRLGYGDL